MKRMLSFLLVAMLVFPCPFSLAEAVYPNEGDLSVIRKTIKLLSDDGMVITSSDYVLSSDETGMLTARFPICTGIDLSVSCRDGKTLSFIASIDPQNKYARLKYPTIYNYLLQTFFIDLDFNSAYEILYYLGSNLQPGELYDLGTSASLLKTGYEIKLFKTDYALILGIYPVDYNA